MASQIFGTTSTNMPAGAIVVPVGADIQSLVDSSPAGSTFWIEAGEHRMQSITPKDQDHFIGEQGAVLNGSHLITDFAKQGANWVASGQTQEGMRRETDQAAPGAERAGYPDTFFIDDKPLTPVDSLGKVAPGKFYFDYAADKIYFQDDPNGHKVEAGVSPFAFHGGATGVTIENLVVEKYDPPTQFAAVGWDNSAQGWTIQNNDIRLNYGLGAYVGTDGKIVGNNIHDNGQLGVGANGNNILIQGNEIGHNGFFAGINPGFEAGGSKFSQTDNLQVIGNYSHDNNGYGLWTDIDNIHTLYDSNTVVNNSAGGISHEISYDATIRNNVVTGNGSNTAPWLFEGQIQIQNSKNVDAYGNHVDSTNGGNGITLLQQDRGSGVGGPHTTTGNTVHDNVIVDGTPGGGISGSVADYDVAGLGNGGNSFTNNEYHYADPSGQHFSWVNTNYNFDGFRQAAGQDSGGSISTQIPTAQTVPDGFTATATARASGAAEPQTTLPQTATPAATDPVSPASSDPTAPTDHTGSDQPSPTPVTLTSAATDPVSPASSDPTAPTDHTGSDQPSPTPVTLTSAATDPVSAASSDPTARADHTGSGQPGPTPVTVTPVATPGDSATPVQTAPEPAPSIGSASHPHGSCDPEANTGGMPQMGVSLGSQDSHHSWADLFAGHLATSPFANAISGGVAGHTGHADWQAMTSSVLQHYADLANQHSGSHATASAEIAGHLDLFHHASAGGSWG